MSIGQYRRIPPSPTKLPADYISRTLSRLLPSQEEILSYNKEQLLLLLEKKEELEALITREPIRFFVPGPGAQRDFLEFQGDQRVRLYISGNKGGKSTAGAIRTLEHVLGRPLWGDRLSRPSYSTPPVRWVIFAEDFDSHKEVTVPTIKTWAPAGSIVRETRNSQSQVTEHAFENGSLIHYRTYDQGYDKPEGKDWDGAWLDEPPPRDIYTAVFRGIVARNGVMFVTATLLKEGWIYDELDHPHVVGFEGTIHDNEWIPDDAKRDFLASLTEEERAVREHGRPRSLVGLIYKEFRNGPPFVVDSHPLPAGYPIILGVDPHERKPVYVMYGYMTPEDRIIWFKWDLIKGSTETDIFARLDEHNAENGAAPAACIMDPNRGKAKQIGGDSWEAMFERHGYAVILGMDDLNIGHTLVRAYLRYDDETPPGMMFMDSCRGIKGPIYQLLRYSWEDWKDRRMERDAKETPRQSYKDFPDIIRYVAAQGLTFDVLLWKQDAIDTAPDGWRRREGIRAYA